MTTAQREAIDSLEKLVKLRKDKTNTIKHDTCICGTMDLDTALSLIKEQQEEIEGLKNKEVLIKRYFKKCDLIKQKDKQIDLIKEYAHQEIVHCTETIKDYIDDDKEGNKHYIEELKEEREHWRDIEKILQNKPKEELYMNWWKYGLYE